MGGADVVVCDGFAGNVMLKSVEGTARFLMKELKGAFLTNTKTKLAAGLVKDQLAELKRKADPAEVGGTPFLGISKPVIKAHGGSDANAIKTPFSGQGNMPGAALFRKLRPISTICASSRSRKKFDFLLTPAPCLPYDYPSKYFHEGVDFCMSIEDIFQTAGTGGRPF